LGTGLGAPYGLAIDLPSRLVDFLEILQRGTEEWWAWYEILNAGFRVAPTAGTDYPCIASYPGRERFYTKVEGPLTYAAWIDGIRRGRTFVTNGPMLEFRVADKEIGEEVVAERPGSVTVGGRVLFDRKHDIVQKLELIENGQVIGSFPLLGEASEISFRVPYEIRENSWLALRARGGKRDEGSGFSGRSLAHSAPVYVTLRNAPPLSQSPLAKSLAKMWMARLDDLEVRLAENQIPYVAQAGSDGVSEAVLRRERAALIESIAAARKKFSAMR
jgi:hypothetical protein